MILCNQEAADKFNFNKAIFPGIQGGPLMHVIAGKAVAFKEALQPEFKAYQEQIVKNAKALCEGLMKRGVKIVSGGTDNHLMLVDLSGTDISGKDLEKRMDRAHITCNKNTIPNDPRSPFVTSGVRLGTPAVTTRGLVEEDMDVIAEAIALVIESEDNVEKVKGMVLATDSNEILVNSIAIDTKTAVNLLHIFSMFSSPLYNAYIESPLLTIEHHIYLTFSINSLFFQTFHWPLFS